MSIQEFTDTEIVDRLRDAESLLIDSIKTRQLSYALRTDYAK